MFYWLILNCPNQHIGFLISNYVSRIHTKINAAHTEELLTIIKTKQILLN